MFVENDGPVHVARQADTDDLLGPNTALGQHRTDRALAGTPPIRWLLFRPGRSFRSERLVVRGGSSDQGTIICRYDGAGSARADIDS
jgi:hypothetical protein